MRNPWPVTNADPFIHFIPLKRVIHNFTEILECVCALIRKGGILAVKGTGGFHLMCDAQNEEAVSRLRKSKKREGKPFAVMFRDIESVKEFCPFRRKKKNRLFHGAVPSLFFMR